MPSQTTPDKTVETFQYNFQFRARVPLCPKETNSPPLPTPGAMLFWLSSFLCYHKQHCNRGRGYSLFICVSKHFSQGECRKIGILVMCLNRFCPRLLLVKELDSSSHIIRHFRHNDTPARCFTSKREANVRANDFFWQQALKARAETGDWHDKNRMVLHAVKMAFSLVYDIETNYMCIYLSELWYFGALV